jgi:hypothetical protein
LNTRPAQVSSVALFVGLPPELDDLCRDAIGEQIGVVRAADAAAAAGMVGVARPRLVVATLALGKSDRALVEDAAVASGARTVFLPENADAMTVERIIQNAVAIAFG